MFANSAINWETMAAAWGPAIPIFFVLVYYLHQLVFKVMRPGMRAMKTRMDKAEEDAENRHAEAMALVQRIADHLEDIPLCRQHNAKRHRRKQRGGPPETPAT